MIDRPFAWPLRNNLRCKWNVYCYFRKSLWNDLYTSLNRVLLKANVTDCVIKFICQENAISTYLSILSDNWLQSASLFIYLLQYQQPWPISLKNYLFRRSNNVWTGSFRWCCNCNDWSGSKFTWFRCTWLQNITCSVTSTMCSVQSFLTLQPVVPKIYEPWL